MAVLLAPGRFLMSVAVVPEPGSVPVVVVVDARDPAGDGVHLDVGRRAVVVQQRDVVPEPRRLVVLVPLDDAPRSELRRDRRRLVEGQGR
jgi:hypothetical protein